MCRWQVLTRVRVRVRVRARVRVRPARRDDARLVAE